MSSRVRGGGYKLEESPELKGMRQPLALAFRRISLLFHSLAGMAYCPSTRLAFDDEFVKPFYVVEDEKRLELE